MSRLREVNVKDDSTAFGKRDHRMELPLNNMGKPAGEAGLNIRGVFLDTHLECLVSRRICLSSG